MGFPIEVLLPTLWAKFPADFVQSASAERKALASAQWDASRALREFVGYFSPQSRKDSGEDVVYILAQPEHLAWLAVWARLFNMLEAISRLTEKPAEYVFEILYRAGLESYLQTLGLSRPIWELTRDPTYSFTWDGHSASNIEGARQLALDRLRAFTTWSLEQDLHQVQLEGDPSRLRRLLVEVPIETNALLASPLTHLVPGTSVFEVTSPQEAELDLRRAQQNMETRQQAIGALVETPELRSWRARIQKLTSPRGFPTLPKVLDADTKSWYELLDRYGLTDLKPLYKAGNLGIHGSTVDQLFDLSDGRAILRVIGMGSRPSTYDALLAHCHQAITNLRWLGAFCFGREGREGNGA